MVVKVFGEIKRSQVQFPVEPLLWFVVVSMSKKVYSYRSSYPAVKWGPGINWRSNAQSLGGVGVVVELI